MRSYNIIPQSSVVKVNCTAESTQNPVWTIYLPGKENPAQFTFTGSIRILNDRGFFMLEDIHFGNVTITQLMINTMGGINGTVIRCFNPDTSMTIAETTLVIVSKCHYR